MAPAMVSQIFQDPPSPPMPVPMEIKDEPVTCEELSGLLDTVNLEFFAAVRELRPDDMEMDERLRELERMRNFSVQPAVLKRLYLEALEICFGHQNHKRENFGVGKLLDLMDQILPMGCLFLSSYWIYYDAHQNYRPDRCICRCRVYNVDCRHVRNPYLAVFLSDSPVQDTTPMFTRCFENCITAMINKFYCMDNGSCMVTFVEFKVVDNVPGSSRTHCTVSLLTRYRKIVIPDCNLLVGLRFKPSPYTLSRYGSLVKELLTLSAVFPYQHRVHLQQTHRVIIKRDRTYCSFEGGAEDESRFYTSTNLPLSMGDVRTVLEMCAAFPLHCVVSDAEVFRKFAVRAVEAYDRNVY